MPSALFWATNASFTEQKVYLGCPAKGLLTDTKAKAYAVRDLKAMDHQTWPLLQSRSGLEDESSTYFGKTQVSGVPRRWQHQRRTELAGGTFEQPTQEAAVILSQFCCTRPNCLQHRPACILHTFYRAVYSSIQKVLWHFDRQGSISETFLAAARSM